MANCGCNSPSTNRNGPWGATNLGTAKDVAAAPQRLESITIRSGWVIDSIEFSYITQDGQRLTAGPWGGFGGNNVKTICFGPGEFIKEVSGTTGIYEGNVVVQTLKLVTNNCTYGPFGREQNNGTPFSSCGTVVGFHGNCGNYLNSIGTYTLSKPTMNGPWGGSGGTPKDITGVPRRLETITIRSGWVIDSLAFSYVNEAGQRCTAGPWGGFGGQEKTICLGPSEFIKEVSGTTGEYENKTVVRSLKIVTNITTYGPFGREQQNNCTPFSTYGTPFCSYGTVVGFHGRCGEYLDSIGTYTV